MASVRYSRTLLTVLMIPSGLWAGWEPFNKNHGPFDPNSWPTRFNLHRCDSVRAEGSPGSGVRAITCCQIADRPSAPKVYAYSRPKEAGAWLIVTDRHDHTVGGPAEISRPLCTFDDVYWADLNADGREDFVIETPLGGCGTIYTFCCHVTFVLSEGDRYFITTTTGLWSGLAYFVDANGDGVCEFIHTAFVEGSHVKGRDGRGHKYWVYTLLAIRQGRLVVDKRLVPGFPKWIWYTHRANHEATTQITRAQQRKLWAEQADRVFWRPKKVVDGKANEATGGDV